MPGSLDRGLHPNALPRVQRLAEEPVEKRARRAGFECRPHLAEDLPLAGNERVEAGRDSKQVERRRLVAQAIQRSGEIVGPLAGQLCERVDRFVVRMLFADEIELGAIAGREHDGLAVEPLGERAARVEIQRNPLAQLDRSSVMRDAGESQLHRGEVGQREDDRDEREAREAQERASAGRASPRAGGRGAPCSTRGSRTSPPSRRRSHHAGSVRRRRRSRASGGRWSRERSVPRAGRARRAAARARGAQPARGASASVPARCRAQPSRQRASGRRRRRASARRESRARHRSARSHPGLSRLLPRRARATRPRPASRRGRAAGSEGCSPRSGRRRRRARRRG